MSSETVNLAKHRRQLPCTKYQDREIKHRELRTPTLVLENSMLFRLLFQRSTNTLDSSNQAFDDQLIGGLRCVYVGLEQNPAHPTLITNVWLREKCVWWSQICVCCVQPMSMVVAIVWH